MPLGTPGDRVLLKPFVPWPAPVSVRIARLAETLHQLMHVDGILSGAAPRGAVRTLPLEKVGTSGGFSPS